MTRLIDADALHEELMWAWKEATCEEERKTLRWVIDLVDIDSPTVSADEQIQSMVEKRVAELVHLNYELEQQLADRPTDSDCWGCNCPKMERQADRPHGEWINVSDCYEPNEKCSVCGGIVHEYNYNYCPTCGARMKGGDDE